MVIFIVFLFFFYEGYGVGYNILFIKEFIEGI